MYKHQAERNPPELGSHDSTLILKPLLPEEDKEKALWKLSGHSANLKGLDGLCVHVDAV